MVLLRKRLGVTGTDFSFDHNPEDSLVQMTGFEEGSENDSFALDAWLFQQVRISQVLPDYLNSIMFALVVGPFFRKKLYPSVPPSNSLFSVSDP